jgi:rod shape-determining protein MreD
MTWMRTPVVGLLVLLAIVFQVSLFSSLEIDGVAPDLALLVVIAAALVRGPEYATVLGFVAGLLVDIAPPADHSAGRWALSFAVSGYLAGMVRRDARSSALAAVVVVAAGAFVATSIFALSGLLMGDQRVDVGNALHVIPVAVLYDVLLTPLVIPLVIAVLDGLQPVTDWR